MRIVEASELPDQDIAFGVRQGPSPEISRETGQYVEAIYLFSESNLRFEPKPSLLLLAKPDLVLF